MKKDFIWDYEGWKKVWHSSDDKEFYQKGWNMTIMTKINLLTLTMFQDDEETNSIQEIEVASNLGKVLKTLEYYHEVDKFLMGRYYVVFNDDISNIMRVITPKNDQYRVIVTDNGPIFDEYGEINPVLEDDNNNQ